MDRDFMGNVIKDINKPKTKYDIEKQYWIEYSEELQSRIDKAIDYIEKEKNETEDDDCKWVEMAKITYIKLWEKLLDILKGSDNE